MSDKLWRVRHLSSHCYLYVSARSVQEAVRKLSGANIIDDDMVEVLLYGQPFGDGEGIWAEKEIDRS